MADDLGPTVRVDVLGPMRLVVDGAPVEVRGPKRRALLALLTLADGRALTADYLVDALWPQVPPESGPAALYSHISRLRGHLGPAAGRLATLDGAYRLVLAAEESDMGLARGLLAEGRASASRDAAAAYTLLCEALPLWRGAAFTDLPESRR
jgi:DNA-binding SARP family transcriptional activator